MGSNGYLQRQAEREEKAFRAAENLTRQFMMDTLQITMHRQKDAWGFDRLMRLMDDWTEVRKEFAPALNPSTDVEADYVQACMDRALTLIINGKMELIPFEKRYPELKGISYKKRGRHG